MVAHEHSTIIYGTPHHKHKHALRRGPAALTDTPWIVVIMRAASSLAHERIYDQSAPARVPFGSRSVRLYMHMLHSRAWG